MQLPTWSIVPDYGTPRTLRAPTIYRPYADSEGLRRTMLMTGSAITTLSTIGMTIVKGR